MTRYIVTDTTIRALAELEFDEFATALRLGSIPDRFYIAENKLDHEKPIEYTNLINAIWDKHSIYIRLRILKTGQIAWEMNIPAEELLLNDLTNSDRITK